MTKSGKDCKLSNRKNYVGLFAPGVVMCESVPKYNLGTREH